MLSEIEKYITPHNGHKHSLLLLSNRLLQGDVTIETIDKLLVGRSSEELQAGLLACYQRKDYETTVYVLTKLCPEVKYEGDSPPTAISSLRFLRSICSSSGSEPYAVFFTLLLECAYITKHLQFIFEA